MFKKSLKLLRLRIKDLRREDHVTVVVELHFAAQTSVVALEGAAVDGAVVSGGVSRVVLLILDNLTSAVAAS